MKLPNIKFHEKILSNSEAVMGTHVDRTMEMSQLHFQSRKLPHI